MKSTLLNENYVNVSALAEENTPREQRDLPQVAYQVSTHKLVRISS